MKKLLVLCLFTLSYSLCDANPTVVNLAPVTDLPPEWTHGHDKAPIRIPLFYIHCHSILMMMTL